MKKTFLALAATAVLVVSCKVESTVDDLVDDLVDENCKKVETCEGTTTICDDGDGTSTQIIFGQTIEHDMSFSELEKSLEDSLESCDDWEVVEE